MFEKKYTFQLFRSYVPLKITYVNVKLGVHRILIEGRGVAPKLYFFGHIYLVLFIQCGEKTWGSFRNIWAFPLLIVFTSLLSFGAVIISTRYYPCVIGCLFLYISECMSNKIICNTTKTAFP